jgi:hypothetical protein
MTKTPPITISFVGTEELKSWLAAEAEKQDRSQSSLIRGILEATKTANEEAEKWLKSKMKEEKK